MTNYINDQRLADYHDELMTDVIEPLQHVIANGVATLDQSGKVPSSQLPSYVDDVIEGYYYNGTFYSDDNHLNALTGETGKIYVDLTGNKTYRWSGSQYIVITDGVIGKDGASMLYKGTAVAHYSNFSSIPSGYSDNDAYILDSSSTYSEIPVGGGDSLNGYSAPSIATYVNAPDHGWNVTKATVGDIYRVGDNLWQAQENSWVNMGSFKGDDGSAASVTTAAVQSALGVNPSATGINFLAEDGTWHSLTQRDATLMEQKPEYTDGHLTLVYTPIYTITKSTIGLGNVGNFKAVSTAANQGLTDTEKSNARTNIGAGTSSFSGSYNDLNDKPTSLPANGGNADTVGGKHAEELKPDYIDANGIEYVDLGLPSGTLWAISNLGANNYTQSGNTYLWGKTTPYDGTDTSAYTGTEDVLIAASDAASVALGGDWRMPTKEQCIELNDNTTRELQRINGLYYIKYTGKNNKYIYIQCNNGAFGHYWSSSRNLDGNNSAVNLVASQIPSTMHHGWNTETITTPLPIRPVASPNVVKSVNGRRGGSITITKSDVGLDNVDNTADANKSVAYATNAKHIEPLATLENNGTGMTVAQVKTWIANQFEAVNTQSFGDYVYVSADVVGNWSDDNHTVVESSVYAFIKIGGGYNASTYGQWMISSYNNTPIGFVGRSGGTWTSIKEIATTDQIPTVYSWAQQSTKPSYSFSELSGTSDVVEKDNDGYIDVDGVYVHNCNIAADEHGNLTIDDEVALTDVNVYNYVEQNISNYYSVSSNQSSIATSLTSDGCENKIYYNSGSSDVTLGISTSANVIAVDGVTSITLESGKYAEINFIRKTVSGTPKIFIRSVS